MLILIIHFRFYRECQVKHWAKHKDICKVMAGAGKPWSYEQYSRLLYCCYLLYLIHFRTLWTFDSLNYCIPIFIFIINMKFIYSYRLVSVRLRFHPQNSIFIANGRATQEFGSRVENIFCRVQKRAAITITSRKLYWIQSINLWGKHWHFALLNKVRGGSVSVYESA